MAQEIIYQKENRICLFKSINIGNFKNKLSDDINALLYSRNEIKENVDRVITINQHLIQCNLHASLDEEDILQLFKKYYKNDFIVIKQGNTLFNDVFVGTKNFKIGNGQASGFTNDERGIDDKVLSLVNSLSSIPGVKTFSSCEGHYKMAFYVLWTINDNNLFKLNKIAELLSESTNEAYVLYKFPINKDPVISLYFAHDKWNGSNHRNDKNLPHFEFRITMPLLSIDDKYPEMFYDFTNSISEIFAIKVKEVDWTLL